MQSNISIIIPNKCYISANPEKNYPCEFFFEVTYGNISKEDIILNTEDIESIGNDDPFPKIIISGFEKLLKDTAQFENFVKNLKQSGDSDWIIKKAVKDNSIIICYTGIGLKENFYFRASTDSFILDTKENQTAVLIVKIENFDGIENNKYSISTKIDYVPFAKELNFDKSPVELNSSVEVTYDYLGDNVDKELMQNGSEVNTIRSPFITDITMPTLFTLRVFNKSGIDDRIEKFLDVLPPQITSFTSDKNYFSKGEAVNLKWNGSSVSNYILDNTNEKTDTINETDAIVYPVLKRGNYNVTYTLRANGYKNKRPISIQKSIILTQTLWSSIGEQSGYFSNDKAYTEINFNSRIFYIRKAYYAYAHPILYISGDGISWMDYSTNSNANINFTSIAVNCKDEVIYIMGEQDGRLYISTYDFSKFEWSYDPAYQNCNSTIGSFAFSNKDAYYAQITENSITINFCNEKKKWNNVIKNIFPPVNKNIKGGDYCFYKNLFYTVMLCDDKYIYFYCEEQEEPLFRQRVGDDEKFVSLIATINNLYIVTARDIIDVRTRKIMDEFSPMRSEKNKRMWLGVNEEDKLIGIYPDKKLWILDVEL